MDQIEPEITHDGYRRRRRGAAIPGDSVQSSSATPTHLPTRALWRAKLVKAVFASPPRAVSQMREPQSQGIADDAHGRKRRSGGGDDRRQQDAEGRIEVWPRSGCRRVVDEGKEQVLPDIAHGRLRQPSRADDAAEVAAERRDPGALHRHRCRCPWRCRLPRPPRPARRSRRRRPSRRCGPARAACSPRHFSGRAALRFHLGNPEPLGDRVRRLVRLSPVSMITLMPSAASVFSASGVDRFTGSAIARMPASFPSIDMLITVAPSPRALRPVLRARRRVDVQRFQESGVAEMNGLAFGLARRARAGRRCEFLDVEKRPGFAPSPRAGDSVGQRVFARPLNACRQWRSSASANPAAGTMETTVGLPSVSVPILSTTSVSAFSMRSSASAFLMRTPACRRGRHRP